MDLLSVNDVAGQHANSWYHHSALSIPEYAKLNQDVQCDVCVIGAGFTGLSTALHLAKAGKQVVLLDANRVGWGASGRNGGQVGCGQRCDQWTLEKQYGDTAAKALWKLAIDAGSLVRELIAEHQIDCDYVSGVLEASCSDTEQRELQAYALHLQKHYQHSECEVVDREKLRELLASDCYAGGLLDHSAGHLHPLNFAIGLARACEQAGVQIHEQTRVTSLLNAYATNNNGKTESTLTASRQQKTRNEAELLVNCADSTVSARQVVLACNGYLGNLHNDIAARVMPINNYIVATEPLGESMARALISNNMAVADSRFVVNYFRLSADFRLLFGGGESWGYRFPDDIRGVVKPRLLSVFPQLGNVGLEFAWGGTLAITRSRMPCFRQLESGIWSASGYSGHGIAMATMAGAVMSAAIDENLQAPGKPGSRKHSGRQSEEGKTSFELMASLDCRKFPGGHTFRTPLLKLAMAWYATRDRLANLRQAKKGESNR